MLNRIGASELILNDDGSIYHINLRPEHVAENVITVGDPARVAMISSHFDTVEYRGQKREFVTHTGAYNNNRITVISTGIGPDNIDIVLNELDALMNIDLKEKRLKPVMTKLNIIRMGTSGSLQADIPVDSMVVSSHGLGLDNLMHFYAGHQDSGHLINDIIDHTGLAKTAIRPYLTKGSAKLLERVGDEYQCGVTVTCGGFYGPQGRVLRAPSAFPGLLDSLSSFRTEGHWITNFEMETSAIYGLGKILGHECLSINTIIANRMTRQFSKNPKIAVAQMIEKSLQALFG